MTDWALNTKKTWLSVCLSIVLVLIWQWFSLGIGHSNKQTLPDSLQEFRQSNAQDAVTAIIEHNLWEPDRKSGVALTNEQQINAESVANLAEKNWQLIAIAQVDEDLIAYIRDKSDPASVKKYRVGEDLPDGKKILKIEQDRVVYDIKNETNTHEKSAGKQLFLFGRTAQTGEETSE